MFFTYFVLFFFYFTESTAVANRRCEFDFPEQEKELNTRIQQNGTLCKTITDLSCLKNNPYKESPYEECPVNLECKCSNGETNYSKEFFCNCSKVARSETLCDCFINSNDPSSLKFPENCTCQNATTLLDLVQSIFEKNKIAVLCALVFLLILIVLCIIKCCRNKKPKRGSEATLRNNASRINDDEPVYHYGFNNYHQPAHMNVYEELPISHEHEYEVVYWKPKRSSFHPA